VFDRAYLFLPLTAAILYSAAALFLKLSERRGLSVGQITVLTNLASLIGFSLFYPWAEFPRMPSIWWPVVLLGLTIVIGQITSILSFTLGDVSVATPTLGTKVVLVAALASLFTSRPVGWATWVAAILMLIGLWLLMGSPLTGRRARAAPGVVLALIAAGSYACFDVIVQIWNPVIGFGLLLPPAFLIACLFSLPLLALRPRRARPIGPSPAVPLGLGLVLLTGQALLLVWSIGHFQDAAGANVVYASRGIWSVLMVQLLPGWFGRVEGLDGRGAFLRRVIGASVMLLGVFVTFSG
jgi:drug/metabolite transporter (DMT)-like permease